MVSGAVRAARAVRDFADAENGVFVAAEQSVLLHFDSTEDGFVKAEFFGVVAWLPVDAVQVIDEADVTEADVLNAATPRWEIELLSRCSQLPNLVEERQSDGRNWISARELVEFLSLAINVPAEVSVPLAAIESGDSMFASLMGCISALYQNVSPLSLLSVFDSLRTLQLKRTCAFRPFSESFLVTRDTELYSLLSERSRDVVDAICVDGGLVLEFVSAERMKACVPTLLDVLVPYATTGHVTAFASDCTVGEHRANGNGYDLWTPKRSAAAGLASLRAGSNCVSAIGIIATLRHLVSIFKSTLDTNSYEMQSATTKALICFRCLEDLLVSSTRASLFEMMMASGLSDVMHFVVHSSRSLLLVAAVSRLVGAALGVISSGSHAAVISAVCMDTLPAALHRLTHIIAAFHAAKGGAAVRPVVNGLLLLVVRILEDALRNEDLGFTTDLTAVCERVSALVFGREHFSFVVQQQAAMLLALCVQRRLFANIPADLPQRMYSHAKEYDPLEPSVIAFKSAALSIGLALAAESSERTASPGEAGAEAGGASADDADAMTEAESREFYATFHDRELATKVLGTASSELRAYLSEAKLLDVLSELTHAERAFAVRELEGVARGFSASAASVSLTDLVLLTRWFKTLSNERAARGMIDSTAFQSCVKVFGVLPAMGDAIFDGFDSDKNRKISLGEFLTAMCVFLNGSAQEQARLIFSCWDTDKSGSLSSAELRHMLHCMGGNLKGPALIQEAYRTLTALDRDKDGVISFSEFLSGSQKDKTIKKMFSLVFGRLAVRAPGGAARSSSAASATRSARSSTRDARSSSASDAMASPRSSSTRGGLPPALARLSELVALNDSFFAEIVAGLGKLVDGATSRAFVNAVTQVSFLHHSPRFLQAIAANESALAALLSAASSETVADAAAALCLLLFTATMRGNRDVLHLGSDDVSAALVGQLVEIASLRRNSIQCVNQCLSLARLCLDEARFAAFVQKSEVQRVLACCLLHCTDLSLQRSSEFRSAVGELMQGRDVHPSLVFACFQRRGLLESRQGGASMQAALARVRAVNEEKVFPPLVQLARQCKVPSVQPASSELSRLGVDGLSPLHWAVLHDSAQLVWGLLGEAAELQLDDFRGRSPLQLACERDSLRSLAALLLHTAKYAATSQGLQTLLQLVEYGRKEAKASALLQLVSEHLAQFEAEVSKALEWSPSVPTAEVCDAITKSLFTAAVDLFVSSGDTDYWGVCLVCLSFAAADSASGNIASAAGLRAFAEIVAKFVVTVGSRRVANLLFFNAEARAVARREMASLKEQRIEPFFPAVWHYIEEALSSMT